VNATLASVGVGAVVIGLAVLVGPPGSQLAESVSLQVAGSETVRPLVAACIESYLAKNPRAEVVVRGGGSDDGIASVLHGRVDIGMASRAPTAKEREVAVANGVELVLYELALDGVAVIVHPSNAVVALDLLQLHRIFSGEITRWRELGAANDGSASKNNNDSDSDSILPVTRAPGSGTAALFAEQVLAGASPSASARPQATNEAIVAEVSKEPSAIGYTSLDALKAGEARVKTLALRAGPGSAPTQPSVDSVRARAYPLTRVLYLVGSAPRSAAARDFMAHCTGPANPAMLRRTGHVAMHAGLR
jgi:phosphate transport system substrate-binding protein